jgi:signal transduction histidine kinase
VRASDGLAIDVRGPEARLDLSERVETELFAIGKEALANVQKHSGASAVTVDLTITLDSVRLRIADDGRGTGTTKRTRAAGHVGLDIVRETIAEAGGSVVVEPRQPHGTVVEARLPR